MPRKRYAPDAELLIERLNELDPETAVTPPAGLHGWQGGMPLVPAWCIDHAETEVVWQRHHIPVRATPPEPVGGREALLTDDVVEDALEPVDDYLYATGLLSNAADSILGDDLVAKVAARLRAALQASPPTGVSDGVALDDQCPERCLGVVGHAGPHQTSDYEPDALGVAWAEVEARLTARADWWRIRSLVEVAFAPMRWEVVATDGNRIVRADGHDPAAALRALAATLSEPPR